MEPSSFHPETLVGTVIDGRYRLAAHLANGGMGSIFRAEHVYMRKELAVKLLRPDLSALPDIAERFRREAEIAASLEHANIVRVTDFGKSPDGWLFLVMELLHGESLFERMRIGPLPVEFVLPVVVQICSGLDAAHARGVVHRDLKPENVFLVDAPSPWVKLLDFGIAKISDPLVTSETAAGVVVGTPEYASPEQASGSPVDGRADVYALGIVAWRMLAGHHPFPTDDSRRLLMMQATRPVPPIAEARAELLMRWPGVAAAVDRACAKDPAARFQSAAEMGAAIEACLPEALRSSAVAPSLSPFLLRAPTPLAAPRTSATPGASAFQPRTTATALPGGVPPRRRGPRRAAVAAAAAFLVLLGGGFTAAAVQRRGEEQRSAQVAAAAAVDRVDGADRAGGGEEQRSADAARLTEAEREADAGREAAARQREATRRRELERLVAAARAAKGPERLRALGQLRQLGAENRLTPTEAYGPLLSDRDCEVRKAAAQRLGEIGDRPALKPLRALARATREVDEGYLFKRRVPLCGAAEAQAAAARIEGELRASTGAAQRKVSKGG